MPYPIILADDHQFLLQGITSVLKEIEEVEIVATALNGQELMQLVEVHRPHLVVLDLNMPGYDGLECLRRIKAAHTSVKVLILTNYTQPQLLEEVKKAGAEGFLLKNSTAAALKDAVHKVLNGETAFAATNDLKELSEDSYFFDDFLKKYKLTRREVDIIRMIAREMSTKEIAATCFLSELTISTHRKNIFRKLDLKNVASLINFAKQNNII